MFGSNLLNTLMAAPATTTATGEAQSPLSAVTPIILLVVFLAFGYFFMIRQQKKQEAETKKMRDSLSVGDEVTTVGGIIGKVCNVRDDTITVETGADKVRMKVARWAIRSIDKKFGAASEPEKPVSYKAKKKDTSDDFSDNK